MYNINSGGNRTKSNKNMEERVLHGAGGSDVNGIGAISRDSGHKFLSSYAEFCNSEILLM